MSWTPPPFEPTRELRDHLPEEGWRAAIRTIAARHDLDAARAVPFPTGSDVVWSVGGRVIKLTAPKWDWQIEAEERWLGHVAGRLSVRTPGPVARGELHGWPYVVMERVPGVALGSVWSRGSRADRLRLARDLGRLVRELHSLDAPASPDAWPRFWRTCTTDLARRHAEPGVPEELADEIEPFLASVGELPSEPRVFLHTEVVDQHVLVEERRGRYELSALIDFADGRVGPVEYEFPAPVEFLFRGEPGLLRAFLLAYGYAPSELTEACSRRLLAWGLSHRYGRLKRMLAAVTPARTASLAELAQRLYDVT